MAQKAKPCGSARTTSLAQVHRPNPIHCLNQLGMCIPSGLVVSCTSAIQIMRYIYTRIHTRDMYIYIYMCISFQYTFIYNTRTFTYTYIYKYMYICMYIYIYIVKYIYIYICIYIYIPRCSPCMFYAASNSTLIS